MPFPVFYTIALVVLGVLHRLFPQASRVAGEMPLFKNEKFGRFANDFKEIEDTLRQAVKKIDRSRVSEKVSQNINFLHQKGVISKDLFIELNKIKEIRNDLIHEDLIVPDPIHFDLLKKCKQEVMKVLK